MCTLIDSSLLCNSLQAITPSLIDGFYFLTNQNSFLVNTCNFKIWHETVSCKLNARIAELIIIQ